MYQQAWKLVTQLGSAWEGVSVGELELEGSTKGALEGY